MVESPVMSGACSLCGATDSVAAGLCPECRQVAGSLVVIPAPTVRAEPQCKVPIRPRELFDYEIISELARGGMGVVYVARQVSLNRRVALKMILRPFAAEGEKRRFRAEAEHTATLEHPNIIPVYDCGEADGAPYFTMKLIEGRSLAVHLRRLIAEPRKSVALLATVARAVHYAHERGILHRDLKPHNILIDAQGVPYVGDFGIAKRVENTAADATQTGAVMGTPHYMSPEQASGDSSRITTASDVYSLGTILYELLTLRVPFVAQTTWEILQKVKSEDPLPPRQLRATANRDLETICLKCIEKDPARRYASALDLACDLERWLNGEPILARPHSLRERGVKWARRRPAVAASIALAAACVLAVTGSYWRGSMLVHEAEQRQSEARQRAAASATLEGTQALQSAREAAANSRNAESEKALIEAEDRFRVALVNRPGDAAAEKGLRDTALMSFDAALHARNWRQAREKLLLAQSAKLSPVEFEFNQATLARLETERSDRIRSRIKALMDDAASLTRSVTHELAVYELIAMKDDLTVELLKPYIDHERAECRTLACATLAWIGDATVVRALLREIQPKTPAGRENPANVQVAALGAACMLAADDDVQAYRAVRARIDAEPGAKDSLLFYRIKLPFEDFARRQARRLPPSPGDSPAQLAEHAQRAGDSNSHREALALYDRLLAAEPDAVQYRNLRGLARLNLKDCAGALEDFNAVVERLPRNKMGYINRASVRSDLNDKAGALSDLNKALELAPGDLGLLSGRGLILQDLGDTRGALADYDRALQANPEDIYALTNRGHARAAARDFPGALADFDRALALSPLFRQALTGRACTRMELHDTDGALADFDKTLALDPTQTHCYFNRGVLRASKGDLAGAIREFDRCLEQNPRNAVALYNRAVAESKVGDEKAAARDYEKTIELDPHRPEPLVNLGCIREAAGDAEGALKLIDRAVSVNPHKFEAWNCRARLHQKLGRVEEAKRDLQKALELLPEDAPKGVREEIGERVRGLRTAD